MKDDTTILEGTENSSVTEVLFHRLSENAPVGIFQTDDSGHCVYVNPKWTVLTGLTAEQARGEGWAKALHPDDREGVFHDWYRSAQTGNEFSSEYRFRKPDGTITWVAAKAVPQMDDTGKIRGYLGILMDITDRKIAEEQLLRATSRSAFLAEASVVLGASLDYQETLQNIARMAVPFLCDYCVVDILENDELRQVAVCHRDPAKEEYIRQVRRLKPFDPADDFGVMKVLRTGQSELVSKVEESWKKMRSGSDTRLSELFQSLQFTSYIVVPLVIRGKVIGGVSFVMAESGRTYSEQDLGLVEDLARRAALAIDNARLYKESKEAEGTIRSQLKEKDVLMKEIHHRVKNNLQIISSLLSLQAARADKKYKELLIESQNRIRSMALIHEKLYLSDKLSEIDLSDYIRELSKYLFSTYSADRGRINLELACEQLSIDVDKAITTGLILNELFSNCLKHAFPAGRSGKITVTLQQRDSQIYLAVADDGVGCPTVSIDSLNSNASLGLRLVNILARQLDAELTFRSDRGTTCEITF